jgi:catechol 2,3-dioxygenase-like lactoylglutathione lyase family enzyme
MPITNVQLFSLPVSDQDRARDFYVDVLGFELVQDTQMGPDLRWVTVRPPRSETAITLVTWFPSMPPGSVRGVVLETADLEDTVEVLRRRGAEIPGGVDTAPWGRFVELADPDGNGLILQESTVI